MARLQFNKCIGDRVRVLLVRDLGAMLQAHGEYGMAIHSAKESKELIMVQRKDAANAFGLNYDEAPSAKAVLISNLSSYDSNVISEISSQAAKCNAESLVNKNVTESLTAELERYKERNKLFGYRFQTECLNNSLFNPHQLEQRFLVNFQRESSKDPDNGLHLELNEVKTVFNQMEDTVE
ncbi:hypothetical protein Tco_0681807 [Tanacetum coccineum]|uniref:Uncharacterized protein n=1 Tax=Tanacetum coccineum TaxID=301880 RepID=A0ABQ4XPD6_9ASTR